MSEQSPVLLENATSNDTRHFRNFFIIFMLGSLTWICLLSGASRSLKVLASLGMISAAAIIAGAFLGFLFGIPKVESTSLGSNLKAKTTPNTNLEQMSDWLTKIIVGAGLTQIQKVPPFLKALSIHLQPMMPDVPAGGVVAVATVIAFLFVGFLWAYFESRITIADLFVSHPVT